MNTQTFKSNTSRNGATGRVAHRAPCNYFPYSIFHIPFLLRESLRPLRLCVKIALIIVATCSLSHAAGTNDITSLVQRGLFEEEANHNLDAAMQSYESAIKLHDKDRKLAATAIFRLGECYRKQGKTSEANSYYQRIVTEFPDQTQLVELSQSYV